jgi:hypothetical protein
MLLIGKIIEFKSLLAMVYLLQNGVLLAQAMVNLTTQEVLLLIALQIICM